MAYARPLHRTPKRHTVACPGQFRDLQGHTLPHKRRGSWEIGPLYKIIDTRAKTGHSTWAKMIYTATCTRCGREQKIEARELKTGLGCRYCRATDKREAQDKCDAKRLLKAQLSTQRRVSKWKHIDGELPGLIESGLSARQIALSLRVEHNQIVHRLRVLGLKTALPKRSKGQVLESDGTLVTDERRLALLVEERKQKARVAGRIARGTPAHLAQTSGKLKGGPKDRRR